jgi:hypothetical protein
VSASVVVLPEADVLLRAFSRRDPDLLLIHQVTRCIRDRRLVIGHWARQALLARTRDGRQFDRLAHALAAFPAPRLEPGDYVEAAHRMQRLRDLAIPIAGRQALAWTVAERLGGEVWSNDKPWPALASQGCPVHAA